MLCLGKDILIFLSGFLQPALFCNVASTCKTLRDVIKSKKYNDIVSRTWFNYSFSNCVCNFKESKSFVYAEMEWTFSSCRFQVDHASQKVFILYKHKQLLKSWNETFLEEFDIPRHQNYLLNGDGVWGKTHGVLELIDFKNVSLFKTYLTRNNLRRPIFDISLNPDKKLLFFSDCMGDFVYDVETGKEMTPIEGWCYPWESSMWRSNFELLYGYRTKIALKDIRIKDSEQLLYDETGLSMFEKIDDYLVVIGDDECLTLDIRMPKKYLSSFKTLVFPSTNICLLGKSFIISQEDKAQYSEMLLSSFTILPWVKLAQVKGWKKNSFIGLDVEKNKLCAFCIY